MNKSVWGNIIKFVGEKIKIVAIERIKIEENKKFRFLQNLGFLYGLKNIF